MKKTTILLLLLTLVAVAAGTVTVLATPKYQATAARPTPGPLLVIVTTPSPTPTPTPAPTPVPTPPPTVVATPNGQVTIAMPVYKQVMALDCETAALQMGLAALGHTYSQQALFAPQNPDTRSPVLDPNNRKRVLQWGNPYTNFVGNVNGSDLGPTGYGVYYPLILSIAQTHGAPSSTGGEGVTAAQVYTALKNGHPVLVWVETGWENARAAGYTGVWTSWPDTGSRRINYSLIEHVVTLSGVSATQVRVNDPWKSGSQYWFSKAAFEGSWTDFNNMAVILQ